jgi:hypothetical protein
MPGGGKMAIGRLLGNATAARNANPRTRAVAFETLRQPREVGV